MASKRKDIPYYKKIKIAGQRYGETQTRPQDEYRAFLLHSRKVNYGLSDSIEDKLNKSKMWNVNEHVLRKIVTTVREIETLTDRCVQSEEDFDFMINDLRKQLVIAVDLEGHSSHSFADMIALWQISTPCVTYVFHPFKFFERIQAELSDIMENEEVLKVMHGCTNDFMNLQRDYSISCVGLVDVQPLFERLHGIHQVKFEKMISVLFPESKIQHDGIVTLSDWRNNPLHRQQYEYAVNDSRFLLQAFLVLAQKASTADIEYANRQTKQNMKPFVMKTYKPREADKLFAKFELGKSIGRFKILHMYRDLYARNVDEKPDQVLSDLQLYKLSEARPANEDELRRIIPNPNTFVQKAIPTILRVLEKPEEQIQCMISQLCHNCIKRGHPAWACWTPPIKDRHKMFFAIEPATKSHQNRRRRLNKKRNRLARMQQQQ